MFHSEERYFIPKEGLCYLLCWHVAGDCMDDAEIGRYDPDEGPIESESVTFGLPIKRKKFCLYLLEYLRQAATHHLHIVCELCKFFRLRLPVRSILFVVKFSFCLGSHRADTDAFHLPACLIDVSNFSEEEASEFEVQSCDNYNSPSLSHRLVRIVVCVTTNMAVIDKGKN